MPQAYLRSLLLTGAFSFSAPMFLLGVVLVSLLLIAQVPGLAPLAKASVESILTFLATFGSGRPIEGALVIGITSSLVGSLFDAFAIFQHQKFRRS